MKYCRTCGITKSVAEFNKNRTRADGLQSACRKCQAKVRKQYYQEHKGEIASYDPQYYQDHKEAFAGYAKQYRMSHPGAAYLQTKAWRKANPEHARALYSVRRMRKNKAMSKLDRRKTVLYRKRIKDDPCFYCNEKKEDMTDDHVYPYARGGTDHWFNLVRACAECNGIKHDKLARRRFDPI